MLSFKRHRREHQNQVDEEWQKQVNEGKVDPDDEEAKLLVDENDITRDFLSSDQTFVFSDEVTLYFDGKIIECILVIVDQTVYLLFKDTYRNIISPFNLIELAAVIMSPSNPMSAAFKMKDDKKLNRSHIIFQNQNMGLMVRFIQELEAYWLSVEFSDTIALTIDRNPVSFSFKDIALEK